MTTQFSEVGFNDSVGSRCVATRLGNGPFDKNNDIWDGNCARWQPRQLSIMDVRATFTGVGWYRNSFSVPDFEHGKKVTIKFDGAMSNAKVYVNGKEAGFWPYGYNTFHLITDLINSDSKNNTLAVRLENFEEGSRWYPGAGLYRNVHVITTNKDHFQFGAHMLLL